MPGIIVGVDDSPPARAALEWALRYARHEQLPVTVVTVVDPLVATALWDADPEHGTLDAVTTAARVEARRIVHEAVEAAHSPDVDVDVRAVVGHPVKELVDAAEGDGDVIVVGSRGAGRFARLLLGSTSSGVAEHAPCTVVVVRPS